MSLPELSNPQARYMTEAMSYRRLGWRMRFVADDTFQAQLLAAGCLIRSSEDAVPSVAVTDLGEAALAAGRFFLSEAFKDAFLASAPGDCLLHWAGWLDEHAAAIHRAVTDGRDLYVDQCEDDPEEHRIGFDTVHGYGRGIFLMPQLTPRPQEPVRLYRRQPATAEDPGRWLPLARGSDRSTGFDPVTAFLQEIVDRRAELGRLAGPERPRGFAGVIVLPPFPARLRPAPMQVPEPCL